ncbi:MAG: flagellar biosynthesis protein FliQ [Firmicutes bacterium]|jgi:flagellar biosynthetic protein FliQ|nr:flagellar biosynthesis protein FliQ [Bacillota bacterium]
MTQEFVIGIAQKAILVTLKLAAPILGFALLTGIVVSLFQAMTQIQELTLALIPKIIAVVIALIIFGPWMLRSIVEFTTELFINLPHYVM